MMRVFYVGPMCGGPRAEAAHSQAQIQSLRPASSGPLGMLPWQRGSQRDAPTSAGAPNEPQSDSARLPAVSPSTSHSLYPLFR